MKFTRASHIYSFYVGDAHFLINPSFVTLKKVYSILGRSYRCSVEKTGKQTEKYYSASDEETVNQLCHVVRGDSQKQFDILVVIHLNTFIICMVSDQENRDP